MCAFAEVAVRFWTGLAVRADAPVARVVRFASFGRSLPAVVCAQVQCGIRLPGGVAAMFESFSERARRGVFFSRKVAGRRGASAIEAEHVIEALILEDQGDYAKVLPERSAGTAAQGMRPHRPFFTAETAAKIQRGLEPLMPANAQGLPESVDMPVSETGQRVLLDAKELSEELHHEPATPSRMRAGHVEPLHMLAVVLSDDTSAVAEVLKQAGVTKEAVMTAIETGEYS
jgi:ATP-dependent Clp protease ATP-binding subunit ClpA